MAHRNLVVRTQLKFGINIFIIFSSVPSLRVKSREKKGTKESDPSYPKGRYKFRSPFSE